MSSTSIIMNLDDFDAVPEESPAPVDRAMLEIEQTEKLRRYRSARDLVVTPEVAVAIREGWSFGEIAAVLGLSEQVVRRHAKSADMQDLLDREARRVMRHLAARPLKTEKYRDLALAMGVLVDKARLLRNEPTEIIRNEGTSVDRLAILLFGHGGTDQSCRVIETTAEPGATSLGELSGEIEQAGQIEDGTSPDGGDEPGGEGQP